MRDFQKSRVYKFEDKYVSPLDNAIMTVEEAQDLVDFVWANEGRDCPPKVSQNNRYKAKIATGGRFEIQISSETIKRWIVIHELAHSLTRTLNEEGEELSGDGHGPIFMATYLKLLDNYLNINMLGLLAMCRNSKIKVEGLIS